MPGESSKLLHDLNGRYREAVGAAGIESPWHERVERYDGEGYCPLVAGGGAGGLESNRYRNWQGSGTMVWVTKVRCGKGGCGKEHEICWPSAEMPDSPGPWYFDCDDCGKTRIVRGMSGWDEVATCPEGAAKLRKRP